MRNKNKNKDIINGITLHNTDFDYKKLSDRYLVGFNFDANFLEKIDQAALSLAGKFLEIIPSVIWKTKPRIGTKKDRIICISW